MSSKVIQGTDNCGWMISLNPILPGGQILPPPPPVFPPLLQVKPVCHYLSCCHGNKITKGTSQNLAKKSEKSAICKDIELKFGIETNFGPLSSKSNINFQSDLIMTLLAFRPFR